MDRRHKLVKEILDHCEKSSHNKTTILFLLAKMNDKKLTIFHTEYLKQN